MTPAMGERSYQIMNLFELQSKTDSAALCRFTDGYEVNNEAGTYFLLENAREIPAPELPAKLKHRIDLNKTVFLDIESTGLRPNRPLFLVGLLLCRDGQLVLRQYLARHPQEEGPLLRDLARELADQQILITYNGKRFDLPYIEERMACHGVAFKWGNFHIDLLWHARARYRGVLPDCRLVTLEENILSEKRRDDVPGARIPQAYNSFVKKQEPALMRKILEHNALDLISLYKLLPILHGK